MKKVLEEIEELQGTVLRLPNRTLGRNFACQLAIKLGPQRVASLTELEFAAASPVEKERRGERERKKGRKKERKKEGKKGRKKERERGKERKIRKEKKKQKER